MTCFSLLHVPLKGWIMKIKLAVCSALFAISSVSYAAVFNEASLDGLQCTYLMENYDTGKKSSKVVLIDLNEYDSKIVDSKSAMLVNEITGKQITIDHMMRSSMTLFDESMNEISSGNGTCTNP